MQTACEAVVALVARPSGHDHPDTEALPYAPPDGWLVHAAKRNRMQQRPRQLNWEHLAGDPVAYAGSVRKLVDTGSPPLL